MISNHSQHPNLIAAYESALDFIINQGINCLPVDPFALCDKNGWKTISVNDFCEKHNYDHDFMLQHVIMSDYGAAIHFKKYDYYTIVYNERFDANTIRWTIAHEIAHIVLGHFNSTAHIIMDGTLSKEEYTSCELEAEWFTRALLAPPPVLAALGRKRADQICELCGMAPQHAGKSSLFIHGPWSMMRKDPARERKVARQFSEFIRHTKKL